MPLTTDTRASVLSPMNFGRATAARMPRMMMTTTNSIKVKPACCRFMSNPLSICFVMNPASAAKLP